MCFNNVRVINPDAIVKSLSHKDHDGAHIPAGPEAIRLRKLYLENGDSFVLDNHPVVQGYQPFNVESAQNGYRVEPHYVSLIHTQESIDLVSTCAAKGGHDIPEQDIRRRLPRSRANFVDAALLVDHVVVYDNSDLNSLFEPTLPVQPTGFKMHALAPEWVVES